MLENLGQEIIQIWGKFPSMKLPPYVKKSPKTGMLSFRLSIPLDCRDAFGKREIRKSLKTKDPRAATILAVKLYEEAQERIAAIRQSRPLPTQEPTDLEAYHSAIDWLRKMGFRREAPPHPETSEQAQKEWDHRSALADEILDRYRVYADPFEESYPGLGKIESYKVGALLGDLTRPVPTISDALNFYLADRNPNGKRTPEKAHKFELETKRNISHLLAAVGDKKLTEITRADARSFRDYLMSLPTLSRTSVNKSIEVARKVINHAIIECELNIPSPFRRLAVEEEVAGRDKRLPFTANQLTTYLDAMREHSNIEAYGISVLMAYLGCRTEEATGIELADVNLTGEIPFVHIRANQTRPSLKTGNISQRRLPLLGLALEVVQELKKNAKPDQTCLFPRYATGKGATTVSAVQSKVLRRYVTKDKRLVPYSARHYVKDALRNSGASEAVQNEIMGHTSGRVSEVYGSGYGLEVLRETLAKALGNLPITHRASYLATN